jgi:hypothetical protein
MLDSGLERRRWDIRQVGGTKIAANLIVEIHAPEAATLTPGPQWERWVRRSVALLQIHSIF